MKRTFIVIAITILGTGFAGAESKDSVTNVQNPGTPASAQAVTKPQADQARQALLSGQASPQPTKWVTLNEAAQNFSQKEMTYHINQARQAYMLKNYPVAAAEIRRANAQLELQQAALNAARQQLAGVATKAQEGKFTSGDQIQNEFQQAINYQERVKREIPISPTLAQAFSDEPRIHFDQARALFAQKNYNNAAQDMEIGIAYLKLQEDAAEGQKKVALQDAVNRLQQVSKDVKSGTASNMAELDNAIMGAETAMRTAA